LIGGAANTLDIPCPQTPVFNHGIKADKKRKLKLKISNAIC